MDSVGAFKTLKINNVELPTCSRDLIEKLIVFLSGQEITRILGTRMFIAVFSSRCREPDESSPHILFVFLLRSILILFCYIRLGVPSGLFPSDFTTKPLYQCHMFRSFHSPVCHHANDTWRGDKMSSKPKSV